MRIGKMEITIKYNIEGLSLWSAIKMRIAGTKSLTMKSKKEKIPLMEVSTHE